MDSKEIDVWRVLYILKKLLYVLKNDQCFWLFWKEERQWNNIPFKYVLKNYMNIVLPACLDQETCALHFLFLFFWKISFLMVLSDKKGPARLQINKSWFYRGSWTMHKLGSRLVFFSSFSSVFSWITFPQSNCISLPLHAIYIYILYIHTHKICMCICACFHTVHKIFHAEV